MVCRFEMVGGLNFGIIGETGQLARALKRELVHTLHQGVFLNRQDCDLSADSESIETAIEALAATDVIIMAAAYTQVDQAEDDEDTALAVNTIASEIIANWAAEKNIPLIYISTDYVFDGSAEIPYQTHIPTNPINAYGRTKSLGEQVVRASQPHSAILRTSWIYDGTGRNFLTAMLELMKTRQSLDVVNDQVGRPTYAGHLARAVLSVAEGLTTTPNSFSGTFHITGSGDPTSWAGFAREIFRTFENEMPHEVKVKDVSSSSYPTRAKRPTYSVLDMSKIESLLGASLPSWRQGVKDAQRERQQDMQNITHG